MAAVLNAFRIKIKLNLYRVRGLLGINSCCSLIISCQVLNQPKCILVLFRRIIICGCRQALSFIFLDALWVQWKIWQILLLRGTAEHLCWAYYFVTVITRWSLKQQFSDKLSSSQEINSFEKGIPEESSIWEEGWTSPAGVCFLIVFLWAWLFVCLFVFLLWLLILLPLIVPPPSR